VRRAFEARFNQPGKIERLASEAITTYGENAAFVRQMARAYGFRAWFFWQPTVFSKAKLTDEERAYTTDFGDPLVQIYRAATKQVRSKDFAIDLSYVFDDQSTTIYIDFAHVSEAGNQILADKMYENMKPALLADIDLKEGQSE
jgi:hypothetical protein